MGVGISSYDTLKWPGKELVTIDCSWRGWIPNMYWNGSVFHCTIRHRIWAFCIQAKSKLREFWIWNNLYLHFSSITFCRGPNTMYTDSMYTSRYVFRGCQTKFYDKQHKHIYALHTDRIHSLIINHEIFLSKIWTAIICKIYFVI